MHKYGCAKIVQKNDVSNLKLKFNLRKGKSNSCNCSAQVQRDKAM